jgi:nitrile hydratase beta subunit
MNSVHDMGGMHGLGPVEIEPHEPVFHAPWEARVFALTRTVGAWRRWNIDASRHQRELIPGAEYLRTSYYEKWLTGLVELIVKRGLATRSEIETGKSAEGAPKATPAITASQVAAAIARGDSARRDVPAAPRFTVGQRVRARNMHPAGHTRLPRYARGKLGVIHRDHGVFVFPDSNAHFLGEQPQHVYSIRFAARELWGEQAPPHDAVYIDMWDDYLEPV